MQYGTLDLSRQIPKFRKNLQHKLEGGHCSQTLAPIYKITHHKILEGHNLKRSNQYMVQHFDMVEFQVQEIF